MNLDPQLVYSVSHHETPGGVPKLNAYQDHLGVWTIGFGTNLQELRIDAELAKQWRDNALGSAVVSAQAHYTWFNELSKPRQNAVAELIYQLGLTRFHGFANMRNALAAHAYEAAAKHLLDSKYHRVDMATSPRDEWLAELLRTGVYTTPSAY